MSFSLRPDPFNIFYSIIFILTILFIHVMESYFMVVKPMIMCSLIGYYISKAKVQSIPFLIGLICALFGDIFIHFPGDTFFIIGVCCFLLTQVLFALEFRKDMKGTTNEDYITTFVLFIIGFTICLIAWPSLGNFKIPVLLYAIMNCTMVSTAWLRQSHLPGFYRVVCGAVLFMFSDLFLGFNKWIFPFPLAGDFIMIFYMLAQYLMVTGITLDHNQTNIAVADPLPQS